MRSGRSGWFMPSCPIGLAPIALQIAVVVAGCSARQSAVSLAEQPVHGGRLVATFRTEPRTFNRFVSPRAAEDLFVRLTQATLVRLNRVTGALEPWLAESWTNASSDGRVWTIKLRHGVQFADGVPLTAADVQFTFQALFDKRVASELASSLLIDNRPLEVHAIDDATITLTLPAPYGPGLALLDAIPILPQHKLAAAFAAGTFRDAWGISTPPSELVGLGPFILKTYVPGERLVFVRNPHYWRRDARGESLPRLDQLDVEIVPDQNAEVLQLEGGTVDLLTGQARPEDLRELRRLEGTGTIELVSAGVSISPDSLWFNLAPDAEGAKDRPWLQREELRRAISYGIDRRALDDTVFLGAAEPIYGPVTPGNREWFLPDLPKTEHDLARAKDLLASIGLKGRGSDGHLVDAAGHPARFSILTQKGQTILERSAAVIAEQLGQLGLTVDVVSLEPLAMQQRFFGGKYDAMYFYFPTDSFDPARNLDYWLSSGPFHVWQPNQKTPATPWEASIDDLMRHESTTMDVEEQKRLFAQVQKTLAEHLPVLYFVAPEITIPMSARVHGATPSVLQPPVLWNADELWIAPRQ